MLPIYIYTEGDRGSPGCAAWGTDSLSESVNSHISALTYPARCWVLTSVTITISLHLHHSPKRRVTYYLHSTLHKNKAARTEVDVLGAGSWAVYVFPLPADIPPALKSRVRARRRA